MITLKKVVVTLTLKYLSVCKKVVVTLTLKYLSVCGENIYVFCK